MVYYENVKSVFGGLGKVINKKSDSGSQILIEERRYFMGIKYKEVSRLRGHSILDAWEGIIGKNHG